MKTIAVVVCVGLCSITPVVGQTSEKGDSTVVVIENPLDEEQADGLVDPSSLVDSEIFERAASGEPCDPEDCLPNSQTATRSSYVRYGVDYSGNRDNVSANRLGNLAKTWVRFSWHLSSSLQLDLSAHKDAGEPVYWARGNAWYLTEAKRISMSYTASKISLVLGDFRILHGAGFLSGSGWKPITSMASPTSRMGHISRHKIGVSSVSLPTRRGLYASIAPHPSVQSGAWWYSTRFPGSLESTIENGFTPHSNESLHVTNLSGTSSFTSPLSIERRNLIRNRGMGAFLTWSSKENQVDVYVERWQNQISSATTLPRHSTALSWFSRNTMGVITLSLEASVIDKHLQAVYAQVLKHKKSAISASLSYTFQSEQSSPFSNTHTFITKRVQSVESGLRIPLPNGVAASAGATYRVLGTYSNEDRLRQAYLFMFLERKLTSIFSLRAHLKHKIVQHLYPVPIQASFFEETNDIEEAVLSKKSEFKLQLRFSDLGWLNGATWAAVVWTNERIGSRTGNELWAAGAVLKTKLPTWNTAASWTLSHQNPLFESRLPIYFSDTGLSGQFPASASFGSASRVSIFTSIRWNHTLFELRYVESQGLLPKGHFGKTTRSLQVIQFQIKHTW